MVSQKKCTQVFKTNAYSCYDLFTGAFIGFFMQKMLSMIAFYLVCVLNAHSWIV